MWSRLTARDRAILARLEAHRVLTTDHLWQLEIGWPAIFAISVPIGLAAVVVAAATLRLPAVRGHGRVDLAGLVLSESPVRGRGG